jgi:two-component system, LytTR family, response regulator
MNPLRVLVVDDEPLGRRAVRQLLLLHCDSVVVGEARNGREAIRLIQELKPDLVFLDVQMPEMDGFAVLRAIEPQYLPMVIFVTAFDTFAVRAFEANALDYLVKPLQEARFKDAFAKVRERLRSKEALELSKRLSQLLSEGTQLSDRATEPATRLLIGSGGADLILDTSEIDWIGAEDYYAAVYSQGRKHLVRESLASLETRLDSSQFLRVHRTVIVNLAQVREVSTGGEGNSFLMLRDGAKVPLSRRHRAEVTKALRQFRGQPAKQSTR